jgi:hypothetical protein
LLYAKSYNGSDWLGTTASRLDSVNKDITVRYQLLSNGAGYSAIWVQEDEADILVTNIWTKLGF